MRTMTRFPLAAVLCLCGQVCYGMNAADYDLDGDAIISHEEQANFAREMFSSPLSRFDRNRDNRLDTQELTAAHRALEKDSEKAQMEIQVFRTDYPAGQPLAQFASDYGTEDAKKLQRKGPWGNWPIKIRGAHEDISHGSAAKDPARASPADIAFTRNIASDNEVLVLKGALMWPVNINEQAGLLGVPSIAVNKVSNDNGDASDVDSMVVRFGLDLETAGPRESTLYWRLNPTWTTDTSLDLDVRGLEFQFEPVGFFKGTGNAFWFWDRQVGVRWRGILHGEYGDVSDDAGNPSLIEGQSFTRVGLKFGSTFWLASVERIALSLTDEYHFAVGGDVRDRKLFKASLSYQIDPSEHFRIQTTYANGDSSAALEDEQTWTLGLGVKF